MSRQSNILQIWGNKDSMNLNSMILTNIQASVYFKTTLFELKTYHEVIDEIYYRVSHLEPWEKGSRRTQGLTGMCGGVRGVGGGGIVSTAFCLLYKLYTLKLTRKQVMGLVEHKDSPYIRALGFMYVRYTQNPGDLYYWYEDYLDDEEELDVKAGGGMTMTIGQMLRQWLLRLEWFDTLFPRIPIPIQNEIMGFLKDRYGHRIDAEGNLAPASSSSSRSSKRSPPPEVLDALDNNRHSKKVRSRSRSRSRSRDKKSRSRSRSNGRHRKKNTRSRSRTRSRSPPKKKKTSHRSRSRSRTPKKRHSRSRSRSRSRERRHKTSSNSHKHHKRDREEKDRKERSRSRDRSKDRVRDRERDRPQQSDGESEPGEIRSERKDRERKERERKRSKDRN